MLPELAPSLLLMGAAILVLPFLSRRSTICRMAAMAVAAGCMLRYLLWRWTETLPEPGLQPASLWMWGLAAMESLALANALLTCLFLSRRSDRRAQADAGQARLAARRDLPAVDVVIATYNEPLAVLERSIQGALALDWPQARVWVLDDGRRDWLREYCEARGVRWVTRQGNAHGKAGNLNSWLADHAQADFVMVLDADFVPQRRFLMRVMGFFDDESVGLVQTPQSFFNPDPIQMNLLSGASLADEQRFFYHEFQPCLDAWGAAFCCGTSFVVRHRALAAVGGVPTCTVTEDMMTTYALAGQGWRTLYLDEPLSVGMAAEGLAEFVTQRARWCLGTVQAMRSPLSPLRSAVGWMHLLCFLNAQAFWLGSVPMMLLAVLAPALFWWTGVPAFLAEPGDFLAHYGPRFAAEAVAVGWLSRWSVVPVLSGLAPLVVAPAAIVSAARALVSGKPRLFKVTPKEGGSRKTIIHWRFAAWIGALMAIIAVGMVAGQIPELMPQAEADESGINLLWGFYALAVLFLALLVCIEVPRLRIQDRLDFDEPARWGGLPARMLDLSLGGARLRGDGDGGVLELAGVPPVIAKVVRRQGDVLCLEFETLEPATRDALIRKIFTGPQAAPPDRFDPMRAMRGALRRGWVSPV